MKKLVIRDLIVSHYENDGAKFFDAALEAIKSFRESGDTAIADHIESAIRPHLKVVPKREPDSYVGEVGEVAAVDIGLVPMAEIGGDE